MSRHKIKPTEEVIDIGDQTPVTVRTYVIEDDPVEIKREESKPDNVNHPPHYTHGRFEPIDVIEDWKLGFCLGNAVKYIARHGHKGSPLEDLKKARWYLNREIRRLDPTDEPC